MITSEQLKAARALARLEQAELAEVSGISLATIKRLEAVPGPIAATIATEVALRQGLGQYGIIFIEQNGEGPGVRIVKGGHPLQIRSRIDMAIARARETGVQLFEIRLTLAEAAIFAQSLGREDAPLEYEGVRVCVDPKVPRSGLRGCRPDEAGRVHFLV